ncbi:MAG: hypothetical protein KJ648_02985 [Candidatus Omnitrophica bacterium]|nr:hypothetical protein [Candidatus Omnitrophota bacterium]MBU1767054.1 hypothetical protein [Candidatus Omnitrophota bacterium]
MNIKRAKSIIYPVRDKENMFGYFLGVVKKYYLLYDLYRVAVAIDTLGFAERRAMATYLRPLRFGRRVSNGVERGIND